MSVQIVAELSGNHLGSKDRAIELIHAAKNAGADAIKLQTLKPECMTMDGPDEYFRLKDGPWKHWKLIDLYREIYLPWEWHAELFHVARSLGMVAFSSPFHPEAVDFLETLNCPIYKVASFEVSDTPLLERIARTRKPVYISTGMADEVQDNDALQDADVTFLHCISEYPAPLESMNLAALRTFGCPFGLSDHSLDPIPGAIAAALGAKVVEKHLTLSRADGGPDAGFSSEPAEFRAMVDAIRITELAMGQEPAVFRPAVPRGLMKSLWIAQDVKVGDPITRENLRCLRPGNGMSPIYLEEMIGGIFRKDASAGTPMTEEHTCRSV